MDHFNEDAMNKKTQRQSLVSGLRILFVIDIWQDVEPKRIKVVESTRQKKQLT